MTTDEMVLALGEQLDKLAASVLALTDLVTKLADAGAALEARVVTLEIARREARDV